MKRILFAMGLGLLVGQSVIAEPVEEGLYHEGDGNGFWVMRHADGAVEIGHYRDGERGDPWVTRHADGTVVESSWAADIMRHAGGFPMIIGVIEEGEDVVILHADGTVEKGSYASGMDNTLVKSWTWIVLSAKGCLKEFYPPGWGNPESYERCDVDALDEHWVVQTIRRGEGFFDGSNSERVETGGIRDPDGSVAVAEDYIEWGEGFFPLGQTVIRYADGTVAEGPYEPAGHQPEREGNWTIRHAADGIAAEGSYTIFGYSGGTGITESHKDGHWTVRRADGTVAEGSFHGNVFRGSSAVMHGEWVFRTAADCFSEEFYYGGPVPGSRRPCADK